MNCDAVLVLTEEVPRSRWTIKQSDLVSEHCVSCEKCARRLEEQSNFFSLFDNLIEPTQPNPINLKITNSPEVHESEPLLLFGFWPNMAIFFVCLGSIYKSLNEGGMTLHWYMDVYHFQSAASFVVTQPILSLTMVFVALCFSFSRAGLFEYGARRL